ncbi:Oidioi.mRNA.OKI2018_I69.PAR.g13072.t1.cds [Oikopleura dioica]|uniref:Oidioi.mRNA.OKI2018_I69.PAR.g13072.t1.cds n=1 Tax=Oikopleura dioica TaxID=34765 RepID=A0ABN7S4U0_OIKDI|nr:Oidioi.mRNA.OKI2018_I69.PAR.g13072.t1.cds [Oikopleura dioica]
MDKHEKKCLTRVKEIIPRQRPYGLSVYPIIEAIEFGYLSEKMRSFRKSRYLTFDIETLERKIEITNKKTTENAELRLLCIAIGSNFGYSRFFIRRDDSNDAAKQLVVKFVDEIESLALRERQYLPKELTDVIEHLENIVMKQDGYLKQYGVNESKSIWPYEKYASVIDIINDREFPAFEEFFSSLHNSHCDKKQYEKCRAEFYHNQKINPNFTMAHWLKHYNLMDVNPFAKAIDNQFRVFFDVFKIDPSYCMSLPKFAMACVFEKFSKTSPFIYSFHEKFRMEHKLLRENVIGGLVNVFSRYTELRPGVEAPRNAKFAPNGDPFTRVVFLDFNALYLFSQKWRYHQLQE